MEAACEMEKIFLDMNIRISDEVIVKCKYFTNVRSEVTYKSIF